MVLLARHRNIRTTIRNSKTNAQRKTNQTRIYKSPTIKNKTTKRNKAEVKRMEEERFLKEYYNPNNTVYDVKRKLGLNNHQYAKLYRKYKLDEEERHMNYANAKYKSRLKNGRVTIRKYINGTRHYLGAYATDEDADIVIETCKKHDWDLNNEEVNNTMQEYRIRTKNYSQINGRYYVHKTINGKKIYYDSFQEECDAIDCVNLLELLDWNKTAYTNLKVII